jgi:transcriptional regulator with XRE-family HTH domain
MIMDIKSTPIPVKRALRKLGQDLCDARRRRRIPMKLAAQRASISRTTLSKIEKGDEGVSLGAYARVLFVLGMVDRLAELTDSASDELGLELDAENLPKRIRVSQKEKRAV